MDDKSRCLLGHHTTKENSLARYSRDLLAKPLRDLCGMLLNIRLQKFNPAGTRSGWMAETQATFGVKPVVTERVSGPRVSSQRCTFRRWLWACGVGLWCAVGWSAQSWRCSWCWTAEHDEHEHDPTGVDGEEVIESASSDDDDSYESSGDEGKEEVFHNSQRRHGMVEREPAVKGNLMQNKRSRMLHLRCEDPENHLQPVTACGLHGNAFLELPNGFRMAFVQHMFQGQPTPRELGGSPEGGLIDRVKWSLRSRHFQLSAFACQIEFQCHEGAWGVHEAH